MGGWGVKGYHCFILTSGSITDKIKFKCKHKTKNTEENRSKLFISSESGKSLSENYIKHRLKNLTKAKFNKKTQNTSYLEQTKK